MLPPVMGLMEGLTTLMFDGNPSRRLMRVTPKGTNAIKEYLANLVPQ